MWPTAQGHKSLQCTIPAWTLISFSLFSDSFTPCGTVTEITSTRLFWGPGSISNFCVFRSWGTESIPSLSVFRFWGSGASLSSLSRIVASQVGSYLNCTSPQEAQVHGVQPCVQGCAVCKHPQGWKMELVSGSQGSCPSMSFFKTLIMFHRLLKVECWHEEMWGEGPWL